MKTKIFTFIIMLIVNVSMVNAAISWSVKNGVLTITGTGAMPNYTYVTPEYGNTYSTAPWCKSYRNTIKSVVIQNGVTTIGNYAFWECSSLESVTIPNSVKSIGNDAFSDCTSLTSITIPNSVTSIGENAFNGSELTRVTCNSLIPPSIVYEMFKYTITSDPVCYIPCGTLDAYFNSDWKYCCLQFVEQPFSYEVSVKSNNDAFGIAKVSSHLDCTSVIITAIPGEGCTFVKWSDGNTQATRYLEVTKDINLTAYFAKEGYTIHVYQDCNTTIE